MSRDEFDELTPAEYTYHITAFMEKEAIENARHGIAPKEELPSLLDLRPKPPETD